MLRNILHYSSLASLVFMASAILLVGEALSSSAKVVERILATVNDDIVTKIDLQEFRAKLRTNALVDDGLIQYYDREAMLKDDGKLLEYMIDETILDSEIRRQGISAPIERVETEVRNIIRNRPRPITRDELIATLKAEGISYSDYQEFIRTSLQRQTLLEREVSSRINISEEDLATAYIQMHSDSSALVFEYQLAHIFLRVNSNNPESRALDRAKEIQNRLKDGESFENLAAQFSEDPRFVQGGLFGTVRMGDMVPEIEKALVPLSRGGVTEPIRMADGYRLFKILNRRLVPSPDFERRRQSLSNQLFSSKFEAQFKSWLEMKKANSHIQINLDEE